MRENQKEKGRPKKTAQAIDILESFKLCRFKGKAYLINKNEALEIGSGQYKDFVTRHFYLRYEMGLNDSQLREVISIQRGKALYEGAEIPVYYRVAALNEKLCFLDLADDGNRIIQITPAGWCLAINPGVLFLRPTTIKALPIPQNGDINSLREIVNIKSDDDFTLLRAALVFILRGRPGEKGSFPIILLTGPEGSSKSTTAKIIKYIIDPGVPEIRTPTNDLRDLFIAAARTYILNMDNISSISRDLSDALSSLATGAGYARKMNYTDADEAVFENCNPVILNGINVKTLPDLQSRCLNIELETISEDERKTETEIWSHVKKLHPYILGGMLNALSGAMREYENGFDSPALPRLADFGRFTIALERGNKWTEGAALNALKIGYETSLETMADESTIITAIIDKMEKMKTESLFSGSDYIFSGSAKQLLDLIENDVEEHIKRAADWPKNPARLGAILPRMSNVLKSKGYILKRGQGRERRFFKIQYLEMPAKKITENDPEFEEFPVM